VVVVFADPPFRFAMVIVFMQVRLHQYFRTSVLAALLSY